MHLSKLVSLIGFGMVVVFSVSMVRADVSLPKIFSENMVLQQGKAIPVWGWADPGETVVVQIGKRKEKTVADANGNWNLTLRSMKAGGPYPVKITGNNTIEFHNVLVGEVWLCGGQSNMQWSVEASDNAVQEKAAAVYPQIRLYTVERTIAGKPQKDTNGAWVECSPETVGGFSSVGYFFGRDLHRHLKVPVGLISSNWGGTPAESWTSHEKLVAIEVCKPILERWDKSIADFKSSVAKYEKDFQQWLKDSNQADAEGKPIPAAPTLGNDPRRNPHWASSLYNAMIAPLVPYGMQGAIWYQGESNAPRAYQYRDLFAGMIEDWREQWNDSLTFLFVQLANFTVKGQPAGAWPELREAQTMALRLPKTGMAVTIDIGNPTDIHPKNKQEVGRRLSLAACAISYGEKLIYSGPMYQSLRIEENRIRLTFNSIGSGLIAGDGKPELKGFTIAGEDRKFYPAKAKIEGDTVLVYSEDVPRPVAVRYAWADDPQNSLYNREGLPASPFRTDDWKPDTFDNR